MSGHIIDLSHTIEDGLITYKGLPAPVICDYLDRKASGDHYAPGTSFHIGKIELVANTGTYVDSPFHRFAEGLDLAALPLTSLADLPGIMVDVRQLAGRAITHASFQKYDLEGRAVLVHTGWSKHWRTDRYFEGHPFLTRDAAEHLRDAGAQFVAIDSYNIDDTNDLHRPVHTVLLGADIPIGEHFCHFSALPFDGFRFHAVPVKIKHFGTFPVRAYAVLGK